MLASKMSYAYAAYAQGSDGTAIEYDDGGTEDSRMGKWEMGCSSPAIINTSCDIA